MKPLVNRASLYLGSAFSVIAEEDARLYTCGYTPAFKTTYSIRSQTGFVYTGSQASNSAEYRPLAEGVANIGVQELRRVMREGPVPWELNP